MPTFTSPSAARKKQRTKSHGRIRTYLKEDEGRDWDVESPATVEGRLSDTSHDDWYVPDPIQLKGQSKYLASDFEVKTEDKHGHDDRTWVRLAKQLLNEIRAIVDSKKFPIKNEQHFLRIAAFELVLVLRKLEPQERNHVAILKGINALNKDTEVVLSYDTMIAESRERIHRLLAAKFNNRARVAVHKLLTWIGQIQSTELRRTYEREIKSEFRGIMKGVPVEVKVEKRRRRVDYENEEE